jgi:hypothetical protein
MKLFDEDAAKITIRTNYASLWSDVEKIWAVADSLINEGQLAPETEPRVRWVMAGMYCRQVRFFRSVILLLEHGLDQEAKVLLRAMFELFLQLKFNEQSADRVKTARWFLMWDNASSSKMINVISQHDSSRQDWQRLKDKYKENLKEIRKEIEETSKSESSEAKDRRWGDYVRYGPSMMNAENLAKHLGFIKTYDYLYRESSKVVHAADIFFYVQPGDEAFHAKKGPSDEWLDVVMKSACWSLIQSLIVVDGVLVLGHGKAISDLNQLSIMKTDGAADATA